MREKHVCRSPVFFGRDVDVIWHVSWKTGNEKWQTQPQDLEEFSVMQ